MNYPRIYDTSKNLVAILQNAFNIGYEQRENTLWTATFSLPYDDPKTAECLPFRYVEIYDNNSVLGLFRILPYDEQKSIDNVVITYECEHVLGTLLDDVMFQYHTSGSTPGPMIRGLLQAYQTSFLWDNLGVCAITTSYTYKWENESLLSAILSIGSAYSADYTWTFDTPISATWTLDLELPSETVTASIRYKKNMVEIKKRTDPRTIVTRLYALGYGEGVNQLTIEDVTTGGDTYIDADATTIATYGVKAAIFTDKKEENPTTLLYKAQSYLEKNKAPKVTYTVKAADLYSLTGKSYDDLTLSKYINIHDEELGYNVNARIVARRKSDVTGNPGDLEIDISNFVEDITDNQTTVQSKVIVNELYAQGAVNIDSNDYQDNCDNSNPAVIRFFIPTETVRVNKCMLSYNVSAYRTYNLATSNGSGGTVPTTNAGSEILTCSTLSLDTGIPDPFADPVNTGHVHAFNANHSHSTSNHVHNVTAPIHTHTMEYGIVKFGYLSTAVTITVDGNAVSGSFGLSDTDINIVPYLNTDVDGKIEKGFHTVEITPNTTGSNPNGLARIYATVIKQIFLQSRGGGNY